MQPYLDTARVGPMSSAAGRIHDAYGRIARNGAALGHVETLVTRPFSDWPSLPDDIHDIEALSSWIGLDALLNGLIRHSPDPTLERVVLASRTSQLVSLATHLFFGPCRNVMVTDLEWPPFIDRINRSPAGADRGGLTIVPLRDLVVRDRADSAAVVEYVVSEFFRNACDGLYLTGVTSDGIRIPVGQVTEIVNATMEHCPTVIDGSQQLGHVTTRVGVCDLFVAGGHKWFGTHHPIGIGFHGRPRSTGRIETTIRRMQETGELDDPLLALVEDWTGRAPGSAHETAGLLPLFTCHGALTDSADLESSFDRQLRNADDLADVLEKNGWRPIRPREEFRTGILLAESDRMREASPTEVRSAFRERGLAVTAYERGLVRFSAPKSRLTSTELDAVHQALKSL